ncbi:hypothetical protein ACFL6P_04085 [Candidatus Latescibacterota bacterium]
MKVDFDGGIKLEFHGAKLSSNGGLLAYRDLEVAIDKRLFAEILIWGIPDYINIEQVILDY